MGKENKNDKLINKLAMLLAEEKSIIRNLNTYYVDKNRRCGLFKKLKKVQNDIQKVKFKLRIEREIRKDDKNNNTSES